MDPASDLFLLREIVRSGSFVAAAKRLQLSPSAVSKRLSRFEERLNVRLFNRTTRTLALTESGERLYDRANHILEAIEEAESSARDLSMSPRGHLKVACSDAFAMDVIVPMLDGFNGRYPEVALTLIQGDGPLDLLAEQVDVAIRFEPPTNAGFVARKLIEDPWVVCASPAYLERHISPLAPDDLSSHRCMTITARGFEDNVWTFKKGAAVSSVKIDSAFSGIGLVIKNAALRGLGIARLANFLVKEEIAQGFLVRLLNDYDPAATRSIYAVYPNREYLPLKVRVFIDALVEHLRP